MAVGAGFEFAGNAFKITGQVSDIDDEGGAVLTISLRFRGKCNDSCSGVPLFFQHVL